MLARTLGFLLALTLASGARAQQPGYALDIHHPAPHPDDGFALELPEAPGHLHWSVDSRIDYSRKPLAAAASPTNASETSVIRGRLGGSVGGALGLGARGQVWLRVPLVLAQGGDATLTRGFGFTGLDAAGLGDVTLGGSYDLLGEVAGGLRLGAAGNLSLPTGAQNALAGDGGLGAGAMALASYRLSIVTLSGQAGAQLRPESQFGVWTQGNELRFGLGAIVELSTLDVSAELVGSSSLVSGQAFHKGSTASEALLGAKLPVFSDVRASLALGLGLTQSPGVPAYRVLAGFSWTQGESRRAAIAKAPEPDAKAHAEPARDAHPVAQPEPSANAIASAPPAPLAPPALVDVDGDGLLPPDDRCADVAEDVDGNEDGDGCPETDNDRDGIADGDDRCPLSGMVGGVDTRGCMLGYGLAAIELPESKRPLTMVFHERNLFRTPAARRALYRAYKLLESHPEITLLAVESYANDYDDAGMNRGIAMVRAQRAIVSFTRWGIAASRVRPVIVDGARFELNTAPGEQRGLSGVRFRILQINGQDVPAAQ